MPRGRPPKLKISKPRETEEPNQYSPMKPFEVVVPIVEDEPQLIPMRKLWELARKQGLNCKDSFIREEIEAGLRESGYVHEEPTPEVIEDYWTFESRTVGKDHIQAYDIAGDYSARIYRNGHCDLTRHIAPNRVSRIPGKLYQDEVIKIGNLESFVASLYMLLNESDAIFDESVDAVNSKMAGVQSEQPATGPTVHGHDQRIDQMWIIADEFALSGVHKPSVHELPSKLAQALEIDLKTKEGTVKEWTQLADEVIEKADLEMVTAGGKYTP